MTLVSPLVPPLVLPLVLPLDQSADISLCLQHIVKCHGSTLLPQFLGMYRVSVDNEETYLMVMRNMFSHRLVVHRKYDLKVRGSRGGHSGLRVSLTWCLCRVLWWTEKRVTKRG